MRSREVARRYAEALYEVALDTDTVPATELELAQIVDSTEADSEIKQFLAHPLVPRSAKHELLLHALSGPSPTIARFLELVIRNRRELYLDMIRSEFADVRTQAEGTVRVRLYVAQDMDDTQRVRFATKLESVLHRPVELQETVDPELMGGARIEVEGHVLDGSMKSRLAALRTQLES